MYKFSLKALSIFLLMLVMAAGCDSGSGGSASSSSSSSDSSAKSVSSEPEAESTASTTESFEGTVQTIHAIQGSGSVSPLKEEKVIVEGIVVGDFQGKTGLGGFFLQSKEADDDPATSEGIFISDRKSSVAVSPGDLVRVSGTVKDGNGHMTRIMEIHNVEVLQSGMELPSASTLTLPVASPAQWESVESMLVKIPQELTVTETYSLGRYGQIKLSAGGRLFKSTNITSPGAEAARVFAANQLRSITLDDGSASQNPNPIPFPGSAGLSVNNPLRGGDTVKNLTGVVSQNRGSYQIQPTDTVPFVHSNPGKDKPEAVGGSLRVASFNVLNYFNGDGRGGDFPTPRGAESKSDFKRQRSKIISAILAINADIVGLMEIENDSGGTTALMDLTKGLNEASADGVSYKALMHKFDLGTDAIRCAFIYRSETVKPAGKAMRCNQPPFDKRRPSLAQVFTEKSSGKSLTVIVNHFKSKGGRGAKGVDMDRKDGQGAFNAERTKAANTLLEWVRRNPAQGELENVLIIGDLNSYAREDPITTLRRGGFTDLIAKFVPADQAYSYVYKGEHGYLDHALADESLLPFVTGTTVWHVNADEAPVMDYKTKYKSAGQIKSLYSTGPFRSSDHDPVVVGIDLSAK